MVTVRTFQLGLPLRGRRPGHWRGRWRAQRWGVPFAVASCRKRRTSAGSNSRFGDPQGNRGSYFSANTVIVPDGTHHKAGSNGGIEFSHATAFRKPRRFDQQSRTGWRFGKTAL